MIIKIMTKKEKKVTFCVNRLVTLPSLFADFNEFKVGDQIELNRGYTATCQKINKKGEALFLLDQVLEKEVPHNEVQNLMNHAFFDADIFDDVKDYVVRFNNNMIFRLPYTEEVFGELDWVKPSKKKQWELMKSAKNRIAVDQDGNSTWYWLENQHKDSASNFAIADSSGYAYYNSASYPSSVRPVFKLKIQ